MIRALFILKSHFFFELADSNFVVQGAYKRACIWRELYDGREHYFVYGYIVALDHDINQSAYMIADEIKDDYIKAILKENQIAFEDNDNSAITSFISSRNTDKKYIICLDSVKRDVYCNYREELSKSNIRKREQSKKKEKSSLNRTIASAQKTIQDIKDYEDDDFLYY